MMRINLGRRVSNKYFMLFLVVVTILLSVNFFKINNMGVILAKEDTDLQNSMQKNSFEENLNLTHISNYDTYYGIPEALQISNDLLYVSDSCGDIQIFTLNNNEFELAGYYKNDLFNPKDARLADKPTALCISGNNLFLALNDLGVVILNITIPENPIFLSYFDNITADEIYVSDYKIYTLRRNSYKNTTFSIYDISSIQLPLLLYNITFNDDFNRMEIQNNYAFIKSYSRLRILNVTNPLNVSEIGHINGTIGGFSLHNKYLVLTNSYRNLTIFNLTEITNPNLHANLPFNFTNVISVFLTEKYMLSLGMKYISLI